MKTLLRCMLASASLCIAVPLGAQKQHKAVPIVTPAPSLSSEAQLALDEISPRFATEIEQIKGWFRERPVLYYNFGFVNAPVTAGRVFWPIHGFDAKGNPVAMRGQRPIFSTIPGLGDYSGIWRLTYVVTADHAQPNELRDIASVETFVRRKRAALHETTLTLNLPIVARGSHMAGDTTSGPVAKDTNGARRVEKTGGAGNAGEWPEEFRDQLQAYFQQLENSSGAK